MPDWEALYGPNEKRIVVAEANVDRVLIDFRDAVLNGPKLVNLKPASERACWIAVGGGVPLIFQPVSASPFPGRAR